MDWSAYSPDLNPIEHVWDALGRCIAARLHHPENTQQLKQMLIEEWVLLSQEMLHQLVLSIRRRCKAAIAPHGDKSELYGECSNIPQRIFLKLRWFRGRRVDGHCHGDPILFAALLENFYPNCSKTFDLNRARHRLSVFVDRCPHSTHLLQSETVLPPLVPI
ncbi:transposable element Tcb2 transposase [Trichonephila clavipes]|nr:transposable element Tcb2 transposase [Trichonephila clavipes]